MKYILVDTTNAFFRARHIAHRGTDTLTKLGFSLHVTMSSVNKMQRKFQADHVVFAFEGRSWRRDVYGPYKANRTAKRLALTEDEAEEDQLFWEVFDDFHKYLVDKTNCTVLQHPQAEADDLIARWIALHPDDEHIIVSSDSDFVQLLSPKVMQYNGVENLTITENGIIDDKDRNIAFTVKSDSKLKIGKPDPDFVPEKNWYRWALFVKCIRGDGGDNVFSAYPGARIKGTRNQVGLREAYEDMSVQGYNWNNFMLQRWMDHHEKEHRVLDDYNRNCMLIDLTMQPKELQQDFDDLIKTTVTHKDVGQVGSKFLKFCGRHDLKKLSDYADQYGRWLSATYKGVLND